MPSQPSQQSQPSAMNVIRGLANLMHYPGLTVQIMLRSRTGFRHLSPSVILAMTFVMFLFIELWEVSPGVRTNLSHSRTPAAADENRAGRATDSAGI
jgi:hypothetical protein